jgi:hypothetical protein
LIKGSDGLKNIRNWLFARTNYANSVLLVSSQCQDRNEVMCVAHRAILIGADSAAAIREFLITCRGRIARDAADAELSRRGSGLQQQIRDLQLVPRREPETDLALIVSAPMALRQVVYDLGEL